MIGRQVPPDLDALLQIARIALLLRIEIFAAQAEIAAMAGRFLDGDLPLLLCRQGEEPPGLLEGPAVSIGGTP
jgi:hypothetical protein